MLVTTIEAERRSGAFIWGVIIYFALSGAMPIFGEYIEGVLDARTVSENRSTDGGAPSQTDWIVIETGCFTIYCDPKVDLKSVDRRLSRRDNFLSGVRDPDPALSPQQNVAYRTDRLFMRVKEMLDMRPAMPKLKVKIFKDREDLNEEYRRLFGTKPDYQSFYVDKYKTIYTCAEDISDSIMCHEMAHAVIDNYFEVVPPKKVAEILASYVDKHLED